MLTLYLSEKEWVSFGIGLGEAEVQNARTNVDNKLNTCKFYYNDFIFSESLMYKYISCLKTGCSPGSDGIMSEHIVNSRNSGIVLHLCNLFTVCFRYGLVPSKFTNGLLVPILKKATLDRSVAKNYRPVIDMGY